MALPIVDEKKMALDAAEKFKQMTGHLTATEKQQLIYDVAPDFARVYGEQAKPMLDAMQQTVNAPSRDIFSWVKDKWNIGGAAIDGMQQPFIDFFDPSSQWAKENRAERQENLGELSEYQKLLNLQAEHNLAQAKANGGWGIGARIENIMNDPYGQTADLAAQALPSLAIGGAGVVAAPFTGGASLAAAGAAMSGIGAVQGVGGARGELYEDTQSRSDEQLQANNEQYRQLRASGMSEQQAKEIVGTNIKDHLGELAATAATSALLERVGAAKIIRGQGGLLKNIAAEVASESLDEGAQTMLANNMKRSNDPNLNIFEDVPLAMFDGALMGGMGGGAAAALSPKNTTTTTTPSTSEQVLQAAEQAAQIQAAQTTTPPTTDTPIAQPQSQSTTTREPNLPPPPPTIDVQTGEWINGNGNTELNPWETQPPTQSQLQQSAQATTATGKVATGASNEIDIGNTRHAATWEIREASDLGASIDKSSNQFRDRTRAASQAQIQKIAQRPDYRYLGESPTMDYGAPTLAQDGNTIIGGNGRTAGVKQAYAQGTAEDYRNDLIANAEKYGFTPEQIAQFEQPILTRRLHNQVDIEQAAIMSNEGGGLAMSALEQAKADATRLPPLDMFTFSETGSLNTGANRNAISQWVQQFPQNQQAALQDGNGMLSQQGLSRLQNAMLYKAYGDSPTLARQIESTSQESRNIGNALTQSANTVAEANAQIAYGSLYDLSIADDLTMAADLFEQIRAQGISVSDWLAQEQLIAEIAPSPEARLLVQFFDANVRSAKAIREMIGAYYAEVQNLGNPQQADMFGDNHIPTKLDILNKVTRNETTNPAVPTSHQSAGQGSPIAPDLQPETQSAVRPSDEQSVETGNEINAQQPEKRNAAQEIKNLFDGFAQGVVNGFRKETKELGTDLFNHKIDELAQAYQNGNQEAANQLVTELRQSISAHAKQHGFQIERTGGLGEYRWVNPTQQTATDNTQLPLDQSQSQSEIRFSRSMSTQAKYEQRIDELFSGSKADLNGVHILDKSDVLDMLGYGGYPVQLNEAKVLLNQTNHPEMTAEQWKKIPQWLDNPATVLLSRTHDKRMVFVPNELINGAPVYVIVEPNHKGLEIHALINSYAKDGSPQQAMRDIEKDLRDGNAVYVDKEKARELLGRSGLQLPRLPSLNTSRKKILTEKNLAGYRKNTPLDENQKNNDRATYDRAKAEGKTELTFAQWQQVRTPEFKAWFGDWENDPENASKVINPRTGEPLVVYHGTDAIFTEFKDIKKQNRGFWFTPKKEIADRFSKGKHIVLDVFVNIRNPKKIEFGINGNTLFDEFNKFDGIYKENSVVIAKHPNQIKSATDNVGTFDANNDDIRFSRPAFGQRADLFNLPPIPVTRIDTRNLPTDFLDMKKLADTLLRQLQNAPIGTLHNDDMGIDLRVSKDDRKKMGRNRKLSHETSQSVMGLTDLVKRAVRAETHSDIQHNNNSVVAVHRLYAPAEINGKTYRVKLTVKDYVLNNGTEQQNLHAIEAAEIESAPMGTAPTDVSKQGSAQPTSGRTISIADLMRGATRNDGLLFDVNQTYSRTQSQPTRNKIRDQINEYRAAIRSGSLKNHADKINIVAREEIVRPENAQDLMNVEGFYNPKDGKITLIAESLRNAEHAQFVAWHELAHHKIDVSGAADWHGEIAQAGRHETVRKLADKIQEQRKNTDDPAATNRAIAHEEAIAELYAAHETGDYASLEDKYKIKIPHALKRNMGGFLSRLGDKLAMIWRKITGKRETSSADVYRLLQTLSRANDTKRATHSGSLKRSSNADRTAYDRAFENGETELTFAQWQQVRTPEFKAWFGDWENDPENASKVINPKTGEPLVVYHGSKSNDFFIFEKKLIGKNWGDGTHGNGFYFTEHRDTAVAYGFNVNDFFLNIRNPFNRNDDISEVDTKFTKNIQKKKFDGVIGKNSHPWYVNQGHEYVAFNPNQIKSATDNVGTFDPSNDDIRYSRRTTQAEVETFTRTGKIEHDPTLINALRGDRTAEYLSGKKNALGKMQDWLIEGFADNLHPVAKWIDGLPISEPLREVFKQSMYRAGGKRDYQNQIIEQRFIKPMNQELARIAKKNKMGLLEVKRLVGLWGSANYAPTANARLLAQAQAELDEAKATGNTAKIRTAQEHYDQRKAAIDGTAAGKTAGGYSNPFAAQVKANVEQHISRDDIQAAMQHVYAMLQYKLDLDLKSGRISQEMYNDFKANKEYVPLTGDPISHLQDENDFIGHSTDINQSRDKAMQGRSSMAEDAIDAAFGAVSKSTAIHGWAEFKQHLNDIYETAYQAQIQAGKTPKQAEQYLEENLGMVREKLQGITRPSDNVIIYQQNAQYYQFRLNDKLTQALHAHNTETMNAFLNVVAKPTRLYARLVTQFTPSFAITNAIRDMWEKSEMIRTFKAWDSNGNRVDMDKVARSAIAQAINPKTIRQTFQAAFKNDFSGEMGQHLYEFLSQGGVSTQGTMLSPTEQDLVKQIAKDTGKGWRIVQKGVEKVEQYNMTFDLVPAFSLYLAMRKHGIDAAQAAGLALDTTNFRKKGKYMGGIKAVYMFAQPIATGAYNLARFLNTPKGKKRALGYIAVGMVLYSMLREMADDDEGGNQLDQMGDITRFIPLPAGDGKFIKVPVGFGLPQFAWNIATNSVKAFHGDISATEAMGEIATHWAKTIAPIAPSEVPITEYPAAKAVLTFTPTIFQPLVQNALNRNAFGTPITPAFTNDKKLKAEQSKTTTAQEWRDVALWLQRETGIDMHPEQIRNLVSGYFTGPLREVLNIWIENPNAVSLGKTPKTPFINSLYGAGNEFAIQNRYFNAMSEARKIKQEYDSRKKTGDLDNWLNEERKQKLAWYARAEKAEQRVSKLKSRSTRLYNKGAMSDEAYRGKVAKSVQQRLDYQKPLLAQWRKMSDQPTVN